MAEPIRSDIIAIPSQTPFWEVAKIFDEFFNNTIDPIPECSRKLQALIRDNPQHAHIYLGLLESRKLVVQSSLLASGFYGKAPNEDNTDPEGTPVGY